MKRFALVLVLCGAGCIRAPELVLVDRATALEEQAAGSFAELEKKLARATLDPRPVALTPDQLETLGLAPPSLSDASERTDADSVDDLLRQQLIGMEPSRPRPSGTDPAIQRIGGTRNQIADAHLFDRCVPRPASGEPADEGETLARSPLQR